MTKILRGKDISKAITKANIEKINSLNNSKKIKIGVIRLGDDPGDISYEKSIVKYTEKLGIETELINLSKESSTEDLLQEVEKLNRDINIYGIIPLRPFPNHIDEDKILEKIDLEKDIDCMNPLNLVEVFKGNMDGYLPCTAKAIVKMLEYNDVVLSGADIVIINRTMVVGKPLAMMLLNKNSTVTICHSRTKDLKRITKNADIVITAMGKAKFLNENYFKKESIVIDVGMSLDEDGKLSGDVDINNIQGKVNMLSPSIGGVGSITTSILINQLLRNI